MSIGAAAERFGLATHVLRHWEATGLLTPVRDAAGRRRYGTADLTRVAVAVILRAKEAGLSLVTIRSMAVTSDPSARSDILRAEADALRSRIAAAKASLELIECALDCDQEDFTQCAHSARWWPSALVLTPPYTFPSEVAGRVEDRARPDDADGKAIYAPRTGKNIEITNLDSMPFFAASGP
ncbi:helix-turn-helix domain-containing protein [Streptomyces himalayensis]|uniref:helix-turn-helix domain-containing protein n=1 Tax=Streptomyces himalayensis TaxID=2820085 RepID=UPI0028680D48|nr:MerR family transcriptional regulator [Streptomyces himalayensis]